MSLYRDLVLEKLQEKAILRDDFAKKHSIARTTLYTILKEYENEGLVIRKKSFKLLERGRPKIVWGLKERKDDQYWNIKYDTKILYELILDILFENKKYMHPEEIFSILKLKTENNQEINGKIQEIKDLKSLVNMVYWHVEDRIIANSENHVFTYKYNLKNIECKKCGNIINEKERKEFERLILKKTCKNCEKRG